MTEKQFDMTIFIARMKVETDWNCRHPEESWCIIETTNMTNAKKWAHEMNIYNQERVRQEHRKIISMYTHIIIKSCKYEGESHCQSVFSFREVLQVINKSPAIKPEELPKYPVAPQRKITATIFQV